VDTVIFKVWKPDDDEAEEQAHAIETTSAEKAAEIRAERSFWEHREEEIFVRVRAPDGTLSSFSVETDIDVSFNVCPLKEVGE
jgi:hypothetical protein